MVILTKVVPCGQTEYKLQNGVKSFFRNLYSVTQRLLWYDRIQNKKILILYRHRLLWLDVDDYNSNVLMLRSIEHNIEHLPIESMKRSEAPSHTNPSFKKKAKPDRLREVAVRIPPPQSKIVKILPTPFNAKQLKSLQYLLSAAAYASILETSTTNTSGLREKCYNFYHGYDEDHIEVVKNFLAGNDRFHTLWDAGRIASGMLRKQEAPEK